MASNWGGTLPGPSDTAYIVNGGTATINMPGEFCGTLPLGGTAGSGTVQMTGGSLCVTSYEYVGDSGRGIFTQSGGTNSIGSSLYLGNNAGSNGTYNLNGGVLVISSLNTGLGTAAFNFNGGTLQASSSFSSSLPMTIGIGSSGTTLNTAGFAVTLSGSLSGPGGLTKSGGGTLTLSGSNTYGGGTAVSRRHAAD